LTAEVRQQQQQIQEWQKLSVRLAAENVQLSVRAQVLKASSSSRRLDNTHDHDAVVKNREQIIQLQNLPSPSPPPQLLPPADPPTPQVPVAPRDPARDFIENGLGPLLTAPVRIPVMILKTVVEPPKRI
jgi:hypothetical protein